MRKIYLPLFIILASFVVFGFAENGNERDSKLVGIWKGFEKDKQIEGVEKHWIVERFKNGTFLIMFTSIQNCEVETHTEKGKWWTEKGQFYEYNDDSKETDIYKYNVIDNLVVKFKSIKLLGEKIDTYEFEDYKIE